jgi:transposase
MDKMSIWQWKRWDTVQRVEIGLMSNAEAARVLGLSARQLRRVRARVVTLGQEGVIHGNCGRAPAHRVDDETRARVAQLRLGKYEGFNDQHFTEKLGEEEGVRLSRATVRRILRAAGIRAARPRRAPRHRRRRERKAQAGMMLLWDGSSHAWLEERGPRLCLMATLDDASGELLEGAHFVAQECSAGYLRLLLEIARTKGLPWSIYMDHRGSLFRNDDHWSEAERQRGKQNPTQVGRALEALGIEPIYALSAQAKGRIERLWATLQDRLVSELRLAGARTLEEANAMLKRFIPDYNRRFAIAAAEAEPAWRQLGQSIELERVCSFGYQARVLSDNTVRIQGAVIDIAPGPQGRSYAHARVEVRQLLDGSWRVYYRDQLIGRASSTASGELRALKGRSHWAPPAAAARCANRANAKLACGQINKERAGSASSALASTKKLSGALHHTAGADSESTVFRPRSQSRARSDGRKTGK